MTNKMLKENNINGFQLLKILINLGFVYVKDVQKISHGSGKNG